MALPSNPKVNYVADANSGASSDFRFYNTPSQASTTDKAQLNSLTSQLSGGLTSAKNGLTSGDANVTNNIGVFNGGQQSIDVEGATSESVSVGSVLESFQEGDIAGGVGQIGGAISAFGSEIGGAVGQAFGEAGKFIKTLNGNFPPGGELNVNTGSPINVQPRADNDWRMRITCDWTRFSGQNLFQRLDSESGTDGVVFPYQPRVNFSSRANYTNLDVIHSNYPIQAYKNSQIDEIQIAGEFSAETAVDAEYWLAATTFFRTATKMFFGQGKNAGNPPIICRLSGYGSYAFNNIPVIITSFGVNLEDDTNYVKCDINGINTWVPILSTLNISCKPIYNRRSMRQFDLGQYANGNYVIDGVGVI